ncbi:MAG: tetratricopeptide repeat protein [Pirellulaceae bacterium]|nr:tetratricopeptide repeat protein [Pirellulaceae bacterium]
MNESSCSSPSQADVAQEDRPSPWRSPRSIAVGIVLLTLVAYLPALWCGFIWDDEGYVTGNGTLRSFAGLGSIWFKPGSTQDYYPLSFTSLWFDYRIWGLRPFGYHLHNVLLHGLNAVVLWRLLRRLDIPGALLAAAVFAVHPVHVESVAWITERKNLLSGLFYLLSLHAFLSFDDLRIQRADAGTKPRSPWRYYVLSLSCFSLAMFAKTVVVTMPFVLPVLIWWRRGALTWRDFALSLPFLAAAAPMFIIVFSSNANFGGAGVKIVGDAAAGGGQWDYSILERGLIAGRAMWFYAGKMLYPAQLCFVYPTWDIDAKSIVQLAVAIAAAATPIACWMMRGRVGRGPLAAALFFGLTLGPASGFLNYYFQRYSLVADHLQYLASIGVIALVIAAAAAASRRASANRLAVARACGCGLLVLLAALTWTRCYAYRDLESLWRDTLDKNPRSTLALVNLGALLLERGEDDDALTYFQQALKVDPQFETAHSNMGVYWHRQKQPARAIASFQKALEYDPNNADAHLGWGAILDEQGDTDGAQEQYRRAIAVAPEYVASHFSLAASLHRQGKVREAVKLYRHCLELNPFAVNANYNLGSHHAERGEVEQAADCFQAVISMEPRHAPAHFNLGVIRLNEDWPRLAEYHFRAVLDIDASDRQAHDYLGQALARQGRHREADQHFRRSMGGP